MGGVILLLLTVLLKEVHFTTPILGISSLSLFATFYYMAGYYIRGYRARLADKNLWWFVLAVAFASCVLPSFEMDAQRSVWLPLYAAASILGFYMISIIASSVDKCHNLIRDFLVYCGNRTLNVLTFHFVAFKVVSYVFVVVYNEPLNRIAEFPQMRAYASSGWWVLYTFAGVGIPLVSKWCIEKIRREK